VVGIPKTIDNDINFTDKVIKILLLFLFSTYYQTFGFDTAVNVAAKAISGIHNEAISARGGVGIVKLMGRDSGFIALHASIASGDANLVLLPEV
jgi:6-phosphofructokinase 1